MRTCVWCVCTCFFHLSTCMYTNKHSTHTNTHNANRHERARTHVHASGRPRAHTGTLAGSRPLIAETSSAQTLARYPWRTSASLPVACVCVCVFMTVCQQSRFPAGTLGHAGQEKDGAQGAGSSGSNTPQDAFRRTRVQRILEQHFGDTHPKAASQTSKAWRAPSKNSSSSKLPSLSFVSAYMFARTKKPAMGFRDVLPDDCDFAKK